jgi:predicted PurR-regulated permease PerM
MKTKTSHIEHFTLAVTAVAGIAFLALAWNSKDGIAVAVRASYFTYSALFVVGALAYYTKPRIGSAILIVALLSAPVVAALVGFPVWVSRIENRLNCWLNHFGRDCLCPVPQFPG